MEIFIIILQVFVAVTIYNVWFIRAGRSTQYRGGDAKSLKQEFSKYGLPSWTFYAIGTIKVLAATGVFVGIWIPELTMVSAAVLGLMMLGAFTMHMKIHDSLKQAMPSLTLLIFCVLIILF